MTIWHCNVAVSLDGRIARPDGSVDDWLVDKYPSDNDDFAEFLNTIDAILMGRDTFDVVSRSKEWPYAGRPTMVMTNRILSEAPEEVSTRPGDLGVVVKEMENAGYKRVWIEGGGKLVRDMIGLEKLDILGSGLR